MDLDAKVLYLDLDFVLELEWMTFRGSPLHSVSHAGLVQWRPRLRKKPGPRGAVRWNGTPRPQVRFTFSLCFGAVYLSSVLLCPRSFCLTQMSRDMRPSLAQAAVCLCSPGECVPKGSYLAFSFRAGNRASGLDFGRILFGKVSKWSIRPAGGPILRRSRQESGRNPARKFHAGPGSFIA